MSLEESTAEGWQKITQLYKNKKLYWHRSPEILSLKIDLQKVIAKYAKGSVLDAGSGILPYKFLFSNNCNKYFAVDIKPEDGLDCVADLQSLPFKQDKLDTVFCSQVLEHTQNPYAVLKEFYRILKTDGNLILSVPHLSCYHELPNDYYRFTSNGISFLLTKAGFRITEVQECGSFFSFIGHLFSHIILGLVGRFTFLRSPLFSINYLLSLVFVFMDSLLGRFVKAIPLNIIAIGAK
jgi:SAM-dependent methyltransferase